jgi:hypothetical protein
MQELQMKNSAFQGHGVMMSLIHVRGSGQANSLKPLKNIQKYAAI